MSMNELVLPRLSSEVRIGPPEYVNGKVIRFAKHDVTGRYFRIGEREAFLLARLDGAHGKNEIAAGYAAAFGVGLSDASLQNALTLFTQRGLLDGAVLPAAGDADAAHLVPEENALSFRFYFWNPNRFITRITPHFHWLINGPALAIWATLLVLGELAVLPHLSTLWGEAVRLNGITLVLRIVVLVAVYGIATLVHECAHAIACKRYGGEVPEMGVMLRYFIFIAYTRIDDILLFHERYKRFQVLAVGPMVNLSLIPIALAVWLNTPADSVANMAAVDVLVWFNIGSLLQLLPFLQTDGYFMFAQFLHMPDLRKDAASYLTRRLLSAITGRRMPPVSPACASYVVPVYIIYGVLAFGATGAALAYVLNRHANTILALLGNSTGHLVVGVLGAFLAWRIVFQLIPWVKRQSRLLPESS